MTTDDAHTIRGDIRELRETLATVEKLQREANGRLANLESRVRDIELWRARLQGAAATTRGAWLLAGGAITGIAVGIINNT